MADRTKKIGDCEESKHFPANLKTYYKPLRDFEIESTFFKAPVFFGYQITTPT